jgi:hypothetical protein
VVASPCIATNPPLPSLSARGSAAHVTLSPPVFGRHPEERSDDGSLFDSDF